MSQSHTAVAGFKGTWRLLSAAPHRMFFLAGAGQLLIVMIWWMFTLAGRYGVLPGSAVHINPSWAHAFLMIYGLFPFFIFGFLATVYPRWMNTPVIQRRDYVVASQLLIVGGAMFYAGLYISATLVALATAVFLCGWTIVLAALLRVYRQAAQHGSHERVLNLTLVAGAAGVASFGWAIISGHAVWFALARQLGLWLFLVPVVFSVSHRMIPFFTSSVLADYQIVRPGWSLPLVLVCAIGHAALGFYGQLRWRFVFDLPLMLTGVYHTIVWGFRRSFKVRLLAMLHIAFLWFTLAMALYSIQSLALLLTDRLLLGRAPLHALGIGFVLGMVVAMASRVSLGHSGRALTADHITWYVLLGVNVTALLRIAAELSVPLGAHGYLLNLVAAGIWLICLTPWVWRYAPMYLRPRIDGGSG